MGIARITIQLVFFVVWIALMGVGLLLSRASIRSGGSPTSLPSVVQAETIPIASMALVTAVIGLGIITVERVFD